MLDVVSAGAASFLFVFLKAFQQRNVAFDHYWPVLPTSWAMAAAEVYVVASVVSFGWNTALVLSVGTGSGLGAIMAMLVHRRLFGREGHERE